MVSTGNGRSRTPPIGERVQKISRTGCCRRQDKRDDAPECRRASMAELAAMVATPQGLMRRI